MAKNMPLGVVIGGSVSPSVGKAFGEVNGRIKALGDQAQKVRTLQGLVGETIRLREEWRKAHLSGSTAADGLRRKLETNLEALRRQGLAARNLAKDYEHLGKVGRGLELKAKGREQIQAGRDGIKSNVGQAMAAGAGLILPAKVSADYNAIIRDIAIKAGTAGSPAEAQMGKTIIETARGSGMARNDVAAVVNQLVSAGMELNKALAYAPTAAKFVIGQGAGGQDTGAMINALQQNARISDPRVMQQALEAIAYQGQAGSFEASDMAKWFPELLAGMGKLGIYGMDAVTQLGAMLQVQMKTAGGADEAANNLKNWMEKIGSGDTVKAYEKAGIDYQGSMNTGLAKGMSTLEASFALAQKYIQKTDPAKAKKLQEAAGKITKETDPAKAKEMMQSLEQALRTGDIFADMQVKAALTAYTQNKALYDQLKADSKEAAGILDKNLDERRQASQQKWREVGQAWDDALRSMGDALAPFTDAAADGLGKVATGLGRLTDEYPRAVTGLGAVGAAFLAMRTGMNALRVGRGLMNLGRGALATNPNAVQRVFVTNQPAAGGAGGADVAAGGEAGGKGRGGMRQRVGEGLRGLRGAAPLAAVGAVTMAVDTAMTATTRDEKAAGYGEAAGTFAGTMAGAAAGAALGSFIPVVGTAIGGMIGGLLGAWGGGAGGAAAGKALFGGPAAPKDEPWRPMQKLPEYTPAPMLGDPKRFTGVPAPLPGIGAPIGDVARALRLPTGDTPMVAAAKAMQPAKLELPPPKVEQSFTFAPQVSVRVDGDVRDPRQVVDALMPELRRQFDDYAREQRSRALYDAPHN